MSGYRTWLGDPNLVRRLTYGVAGGMVVVSMLAAVGEGTTSSAVAAVVPVVVVLSLPSRRWRSTVLAAGALFVAAWTFGDSSSLWLAVAALVFGSIAEDQRSVPWVGWAGGLLGSMLSLMLSAGPSIAPFVGTLVGGGAALLLRSRLRTIELAHETEELRGQAAWLEQRTHVARELHDVVGHLVTAIVVQAEAGQVSDPGRALRSIGDLGRTALGELDALVVHLRDPSAALTVSAPPRLLDIEELLAEPLRLQGVAVSVRLADEPGLDEGGVLTVYRIAQEALTNVARHARASHAWVDLDRVGHSVRLRVSDDGVGPTHVPGRDSGLLGIEERVSARGGTWAIGERPGGGTVLDVHLPVASP
ncbi:MAG: histidine kinase [Nocardioides sp.]